MISLVCAVATGGELVDLSLLDVSGMVSVVAADVDSDSISGFGTTVEMVAVDSSFSLSVGTIEVAADGVGVSDTLLSAGTNNTSVGMFRMRDTSGMMEKRYPGGTPTLGVGASVT